MIIIIQIDFQGIFQELVYILIVNNINKIMKIEHKKKILPKMATEL